MSYQALARKYRPETFDQVVGQTHVTGTLRAALRKEKLSHAYLFSGPRGCGKTTVARLLAKAINCLENRQGDPCGTCETCMAIARGNYLDVLEIDAASNTGVDNIRELRDMAQYSPSEGSSRVFIIDEVHMLSKGAFNALLKILEEPPARVFFFFATTEPNKIPRTILSRCQRFDFRLLSRDELAGRLNEIATAEGVTLEDTGLRLLVSLAEGSVRDGLSLLDQVVAGADGVIDEAAVVAAFGLVRSELFIELNEAIVTRDSARALRLVADLADGGQSLEAFARGVVANFRNLMILKIDPDLAPMVDLPPDQVETLSGQAGQFQEQDLLALIDRSSRHFEKIHRSTQPRILLEASLVEYCRFESRVLLADLARRLEALGADATGGGLGGGGVARDARGPVPKVPTPKAPARGASARPARTGATPDLTAADAAVPGWTGLIDQLMKQNPRLGSCLMNGLPRLAEDGTRLTVSFTEDKKFQVTSIAAECSTIEKQINALWGRRIKVELVLGKQGQANEVKEEIRQEVAPTHREELDKACKQDKSLGDLVDMMGGQPLPDSERERWDPPSK
ncbi:MAG: DNA polymerase III subunit gamma/tau [Candidatus Krumholzibacteria bacterium]|nr:DNA polymerase III subunit gamma/tau [Candidatus Krumholzibacteria bacterium]